MLVLDHEKNVGLGPYKRMPRVSNPAKILNLRCSTSFYSIDQKFYAGNRPLQESSLFKFSKYTLI
jgi:hypothetical protein